jgi:hypothetical protein
METMWSVYYNLLRIIHDRELFRDSTYMVDGHKYDSFESYWEKVVQRPFNTWT